VASKLGCVVTHIRSEQVRQEKPNVFKRKRKYMRHVLRAGAPVKSRPDSIHEDWIHEDWLARAASEGVERYLSEVSIPEFRVPIYYGRTATAEGDTGIGNTSPTSNRRLITLSRDELRHLVRAVAQSILYTADVVRKVPGLPVGLWYLQPVADRLRAALVAEETMLCATLLCMMRWTGSRRSKPALWRGSHQSAIASSPIRISPVETCCSSRPEPSDNVRLGNGRNRSARRVSAPLRKVGCRNSSDLAQHYVDYLQAKGIPIEVADVLFVMCTANVFASLTRGFCNSRMPPN
jgi:hypothetical protein